MFIAMNRFKVLKGAEDDFEQVWQRQNLVASVFHRQRAQTFNISRRDRTGHVR